MGVLRKSKTAKRDRLEGLVDETLPLEDRDDFNRARSESGAWLVTWRERRALALYRASSKGTNASLFDPTKPRSLRTERRIESLDSALAKAPMLCDPLTVYRGERHPRLGLDDGYTVRSRWGTYESVPQNRDGILRWAREQWPIGTEVNFHGYASFAATTAVAMRFTAYETSRPAFLFRTQARRFSHPGLVGAPSLMREYEIILPRDSSATVTGVSLQRIQHLPPFWGRPGVINYRPKALSAFVVVDIDLDEDARAVKVGGSSR